jgi:glutamyl-tRNA reductase
MIQDFTIIHRRKPHVFTGIEAPVWSTCLRSLAFVDGAPSFDLMPGDEVYSHAVAYGFLLEAVCGLHSPIVGETEVFGQFKRFAEEWTRLEPGRAPLLQRVLGDAKDLRRRYLNGMGAQSYGSFLRKHLDRKRLDGGRIHLLGGGHLAREILPYLAKHGDVVVHVRTPAKVDFHPYARGLSERAFDGGALVIAAPMTAADIHAWLDGGRPERIFDLRETSGSDPVAAQAVPLQDIFGQIARTKARLSPVVRTMKDEIRLCSEKFNRLEKIRPQGWDDLCA